MRASANDHNQFLVYPISKILLDSPIQLDLSPRPTVSPLAPANTPGTPTALKHKGALSTSSAAGFELSPCRTPPLPLPRQHQQQTIIPASIWTPPALPDSRVNLIPAPAPSTFSFVVQPDARRVRKSSAGECFAVNSSDVNLNGKRGGNKEEGGEGRGESADDEHPPIAFLREPSASPPPLAMRFARRRLTGGGQREGAQTPTSIQPTRVETETPMPTQIQARAAAPVFPFTFRADVPPDSQGKAKPAAPAARVKSNYSRANSLVPPARANPNSNAESHAQARPRRVNLTPAPRREYYYGEEYVPARVGVLGREDQGPGGEPMMGLESALAWAERVQAEMGMGMGMEVDATASQAPLEGGVYQARPNTAPTADYVRLLEETFGPGSVLRGEGEKPVALGSRRKGAKGRDGSVGTSVSAGTGRGWSVSGSEVDVDVGMEVDSGDAGDQSLLDGQAEHEAEHDGDARPSRVSVWMADLQVLVKGKRKMTRADMASLAQTMEDIKDVDAEEVSTDGPQLWRCLWEVSQLAVEDVPFGDEHGLRKMARRLLRHWPEEL